MGLADARWISCSTAFAMSETNLECHLLCASRSATSAWQSGQDSPEGLIWFRSSTVRHLLGSDLPSPWHGALRKSTAAERPFTGRGLAGRDLVAPGVRASILLR